MRLTATLLFVLLALTPLARADEWSKTYAITGKPELRVETRANIYLTHANKRRIFVP